MNTINELSCEFAAAVFARMETSQQMTPQEAANLIRRVYNTLQHLEEQSSSARTAKILQPHAAPKEKSVGSGH